jgi:uncharacterized protein YfaS (alpha-2-macroglobulin family)
MDDAHSCTRSPRFLFLFSAVLLAVAATPAAMRLLDATANDALPFATYTHGTLHVTIPYDVNHAGSGELTVEVLDPEDHVLGKVTKSEMVARSRGGWRQEVKLAKPLPLDELVWDRVRYRFEYGEGKYAAIEGTESISQMIRTPVIHILGQQSYLAGGEAAVRVIVTDSKNEIIPGRGSVQIELLTPRAKPKIEMGQDDSEHESQESRLLFTGSLNHRGTTEAQFRFPVALTGSYQLRYVVDTAIGSSEFTQNVRLDEKASILLTTEKPIYQPGQTIHMRILALDRSNHEAVASRKLTFEVEDSRGNKVFKKATQTDKFGVASAEFALAEEVNLGTYHVRALMGEADAATNSAEIALNVERYVLPKFKVAVEFADKDKNAKHGYRPGDHIIGTVHANYFFGKPVDEAEIEVKASSMDVAVYDVGSSTGKTDVEGIYHFDLKLPAYFAGRPLDHGATRVLIEATVKDSAGHSETRGEPITVAESPILITAVPEGGTLIPNLENQVFILTSYPDGTPAKTNLTVHLNGIGDQPVSSDEGGVAIVRVHAGAGTQTLKVDARDNEGNQASSDVKMETRTGDEQILLRTERAIYGAGDRIQLKVLSTKERGTAYIDVVKEGQTVLTRDVELVNGQTELSLAATPDLAGTVDVNAYLFGRDARPVGDHRLVFVQPADELKIEASTDGAVYRPGDEARVHLRVTNSHGAGVSAALGLQVVDEAVFALAEKQPGFAKVFFYLEQEVMKPRYEIHSVGMQEIVEPVEESKLEQKDRAARALFSATELVDGNKFETEFGRTVPMAKYPEYFSRYQAAFRTQVERLASRLTAEAKAERTSDLTKAFEKLKDADVREVRDSWGNKLRIEPANWFRDRRHYLVRSPGGDRQFYSADDLAAYIEIRRGIVAGPPDPNHIELRMEHDRGPFNGLAEIAGNVIDPSGAVIPGASIEVRDAEGKKRKAHCNNAGQFSLAGLPSGEYTVQIESPGFQVAQMQRIALQPRDRAVLSVTLQIGATTEMVEVTAETHGVGFGVGGGVMGGIAGGVAKQAREFDRLEQFAQLQAPRAAPVPAVSKAILLKATDQKNDSPAVHVRSYFPEALYINPEIITDKDGRASISIPLADSITTWRMAMLASTVRGALGTATSRVKVFQDFFVDLDMPVTLTQGDRVSIPVAVYNYSPAKGEVNFQLHEDNWFTLVDDASEKSVSVDSARVGGSQFTLEANRIGKFKVMLTATMKGDSARADVVVREIEVVPNGREQSEVFNGRLENQIEHEVSFPPTAIPDASKIFVRLYPGPLSQVVEGMDTLLRMPYGCFEQTSSTTYPNVLALDYMKRTKKLTPEVHAKAEGFIANGYQRLLTFEVPGGGFSWFGNAPANKILTSYGLMEFYDMSKVHDVDPKLIQRTQQWLASQQEPDGSWKPDTGGINEGAINRYSKDVVRIAAYIAWSLENTEYQGSAVEKAKRFVENHMDSKMDAYTLAVIANFAVDYQKDRDFTRQAMGLLLDARTEKDDKVWWSADETSVYATGASAAVETTGLAVQALLKWGEASEPARKALSYIAAKKDAAGTWGTTQATIMALRALLLSTEKGAADVRGTVEVLLNGKTVERLALTPQNNDLLHQFVFRNIDERSPNVVQVRFDGKGGLAYQVVGSFFLPWDEKPANEAMSIDLAYDRTHLAQDDIATATATIKNNLPKSANMVMVDLGIAPGFDLLSEDLQAYQEKSKGLKSGRLEKFSLTATQAILYFDSFAPGDTVKLRFRLRAKYPIRARTFQSRVYEYYDPQVNAVARPVQLEVRKS